MPKVYLEIWKEPTRK